MEKNGNNSRKILVVRQIRKLKIYQTHIPYYYTSLWKLYITCYRKSHLSAVKLKIFPCQRHICHLIPPLQIPRETFYAYEKSRVNIRCNQKINSKILFDLSLYHHLKSILNQKTSIERNWLTISTFLLYRSWKTNTTYIITYRSIGVINNILHEHSGDMKVNSAWKIIFPSDVALAKCFPWGDTSLYFPHDPSINV